MGMNTRIQKWGNSLAVRIPSEICEVLRLKEGISVALERKGNTMIVFPTVSKYTLSDIKKGMTVRHKHKIAFQDNKPRGKEIW